MITITGKHLITFQFTHPGRGATDLFSKAIPYISFQFTHPGRGATDAHLYELMPEEVSIHAPREGCDSSTSGSLPIAFMFQFTHPGRGATVWCKVAYYRADKQA